MSSQELTDRERRVLVAVISSYVVTAEPAGSRTLSRRFGLGVSPATIRNTMSDLEEKGFLLHPHTSAGRVPTNKAYRAYVDALLSRPTIKAAETDRLAEEITGSYGSSPIESILRRAAQTLGVLTQELGVALGPRLDLSTLRRLELVRVSSERLLMVLTLDGGVMRTVFVEMPGEIADSAIGGVTAVLNARLAGLTLALLRTSLAVRLRRLLALTETPQALEDTIRRRVHAPGISITIGSEHDDPRLEDFTVVTAEYHVGALAGVIGVIGPPRMSYEKVISLVSLTSQLLSDLLD